MLLIQQMSSPVGLQEEKYDSNEHEMEQLPNSDGENQELLATVVSFCALFVLGATNAEILSSASVCSSFLLSSSYHAFERQLRTEGAVDLSRRSDGGGLVKATSTISQNEETSEYARIQRDGTTSAA